MIKWIAVLLMIIDHVGYYLGFLMPEPIYILLRLVGRLSFPLFAYSIALGFLRTKNRTRYFSRMFLFAVITQALLMITSYFTHGGVFINVMFTFSLAILFMAASELLEKAAGAHNPGVELFGRTIPVLAAILLSIAAMLVILGLTFRFNPDYNIFGILTVFLFYYILKKIRKPDLVLAKDKHALLIMFVSFLGLNLLWSIYKISFSSTELGGIILEIFSVFSIGILLLEKPRLKPARMEKYFFYIFYPAHLVLFMIIRFLLPQLMS